jgi:orotate phosphoribosyltransferase
MTPEDVARLLVRLGAVEVRADPEKWFVWASGRRAPIYCDNRRLLGYPEERAQIAEALTRAVRDHSQVHGIAGTATAGIPWAALVAERLSLPMAYVRSAKKEHGQARQVEGRLPDGCRVVLIEDLVSLGGSSAQAVEALRTEGFEVLGVQAIFTYGLSESERLFSKLGTQLRTLSDFPTLLTTLDLTPEQLDALNAWREGA